MPFFSRKNLYGYHFTLYPDLEVFFNATKTIGPKNFHDYIPHFKKLIKSRFVADFLTIEAQKINETRDYDMLDQDIGMQILNTPEYIINFGKLPKESFVEGNRPEAIGFESTMVSCNLGPGNIELEIYEVPKDQHLDIFDRSKIPTLKRKIVQKVGDFLTINAGKEVVKVIGVDQDAFQIYMVSTEVQELVWHYHEKTLEPIYSTVGSPQISRLQCVMMMLANLGSQKAVFTLKKLISAKEHFLRWSAIKTILALNPTEGYPLLVDATNDPHPHVQKAATTTLALWSNLQHKESQK